MMLQRDEEVWVEEDDDDDGEVWLVDDSGEVREEEVE